MKEQEILKNLIGKVLPVDTFEDEMAKLLHSRKIEWSNLPTSIWDGKEWRKVNYRITYPKTNYFFCLILDRESVPGQIKITEGYLEKL